jgi:YggT family protein
LRGAVPPAISAASLFPGKRRMFTAIVQILNILLTVLWWIIVIQAIMSWLIAFNVINTYNDTVRAVWGALDRMTEPLYRPIRKVLPDFGALDLSPLVVLLVIYIGQVVLIPRLYAFAYSLERGTI